MFFRKKYQPKELQGENGPFYFRAIPARHNRSREIEPPRFKVWIPLKARGYLWIGKETRYDRICKKLGLSTEVEVGIEEFDQNYFIATSHPRFIQTFLLNSTHQEHLNSLFSNGYDELLFDGKKLQARYSEYRRAIPDSGNLQIHTAEPLLRAIGQHLPECFFGSSTFNYHITKWLNQWGGRVGFSLLILSLIIGALLSAAVTAIDKSGLFRFSIGYLAIFLTALLLPLILYLRSHPIRGSKLLKLILFPLPGLLVLSFGLLGLTNQILDPGPASSYTLQVIDKHSKRNENRTSYYIKVVSWHNPGETVTLPVHEPAYRRLEPKSSTIELIIGDGFFGFEWFSGYRVL